MNGKAMTGLGRRDTPTLHWVGDAGIVCGTRKTWVYADEFKALVDAMIRNGKVCPTCYPNGVDR